MSSHRPASRRYMSEFLHKKLWMYVFTEWEMVDFWFIDYTCMAFQFKYKFIWQLSEKVVRAVKRVTQNRTAILYTCRHFLTGFFIQKLTKIVVRRKIANLNCFGQFSKCKQNHDLSFVYTTKNCEIRILLILNDWLWQILVDY